MYGGMKVWRNEGNGGMYGGMNGWRNESMEE